MRAATTPCPGPCNRAWRNAEAAGAGRDLLPTYAPSPRLWCDRDTNLVQRALGALPTLIVDIHQEAAFGTPTPGEKVRRTTVSASWPGEAAHKLADMITAELLHLEDQMRILRGWTPRIDGPDSETAQHRRAGAALTDCLRVLTNSLDWLLANHPAAADPDGSPGARILHWQRAAEHFTRQDRPREVIRDLPCPRCDLMTLTRRPGDDLIDCGNPDCSAVLTHDEYRDWGLQHVAYWRAHAATAAA